MVDWKRLWKNVYTLHWGQIIQDIISWRHYNHDANINELSFNEETGSFRLDITTIKMRDMSPNALLVTGEKYQGFITKLVAPFRAEKRIEVDDEGNEKEYLNPSAISYYLYMINNDINTALTADMKRFILNPKLIVVMLAVALGLVGLWYFLG